jgi:serine/threonine-protein kinase
VVIGETLGGYKVVHKLGEGGMGIVYLAEHSLIGRKAAIKVLHAELSKDQEIVSRFFNEARSTAMIRHPGLVDVFDFGYHAGGSAYLAMEFLDGESLGVRLRREGRLGPALALGIAQQVAAALAAAHDKGIVHRDLKPDNLFLVPDRLVAGGVRVKVLDFGIAKLAQEGPDSGVRTRTGAVMGTPLYMSPEQCKGAGQVDHRADVYALGCILFECLAGRPPFLGDGFGEIIGKHMYEAPPALSSLVVGVSAPVEALVARALAKGSAQRFASMHEFEAALAAAAGGAPPNVALAATIAPTTPVGPTPPPVEALAPTTPPPDRTLPSHPPQPSTLSAAAGEEIPPITPATAPTGAGRYTRRRWILGAAGAVVVAAVAVVALQGDKPLVAVGSTAADATVIAAVFPDAGPVVVATPADAAVVVAPPDAAPPDAAVATSTPPAHDAVLESLGERDIEKAMAPARKRINACAAEHGVSGQVVVRLDVSGDGRVSNVSVTDGNMGTPFGNCVEEAVGAVRFPRWKGPKKTLKRVIPVRTAAAPRAPADPESAETYANQARDAFRNGQYGRAFHLAGQGLAVDPRHVDLIEVGAASACKLKNEQTAASLYARLPKERHNLVRQICLAQGIDLP